MYKDFIKGFIVGFVCLIPGISGASFAIIFNIYNRIINGISNFFINPLKIIKDLFFIILGGLIGILLVLFLLKIFILKYPVYTTIFFIGIVLGNLDKLIMNISFKKLNNKNIIIILIVLIMFFLINNFKINDINKNPNFIINIIIGLIMSISFIFPGVSGSIILLGLGYYNYYIILGNKIIKNIINFEFSYLFTNLLELFPLLISIIIFSIFISKVYLYLNSKHYNTTNIILFGIILLTSLTTLFKLNLFSLNLIMFLKSLLFLFLGFILKDILNILKKEGD